MVGGRAYSGAVGRCSLAVGTRGFVGRTTATKVRTCAALGTVATATTQQHAPMQVHCSALSCPVCECAPPWLGGAAAWLCALPCEPCSGHECSADGSVRAVTSQRPQTAEESLCQSDPRMVGNDTCRAGPVSIRECPLPPWSERTLERQPGTEEQRIGVVIRDAKRQPPSRANRTSCNFCLVCAFCFLDIHPAGLNMRIGALLALTLLAAPLTAQETPTEREAARDVLKKMAALEQSIDVPSIVTKLTAPNPAREAVVARAKELMDKELIALGDDITKNPEVGFVEYKSIKKLTDYLKAHDFAFVARYRKNNGTPTLGVILEYDALRGTKGAFHGDQHSTQGPIGIAAAVAMAEYLSKNKLPGSVIVYGTPGEEMMPPNAKTDMFEAGVFNGADILVRSHSSPATTRPQPGFGTCCMNINGTKYTFSGAPAHQLTAWAGRNALTAVIHLFDNIDGIRSNIRPESRVQGVIMEGGTAPNVVPDRTVADFYIRYPDVVYLEQRWAPAPR